MGILYLEIKELLTSDTLKEEFAYKCMNDRIRYAGPDIVTLPYKFILLEKINYFVDQEMFPRIKRNIIPPSISEVSYRVDLSSLEDFKVI